MCTMASGAVPPGSCSRSDTSSASPRAAKRRLRSRKASAGMTATSGAATMPSRPTRRPPTAQDRARPRRRPRAIAGKVTETLARADEIPEALVWVPRLVPQRGASVALDEPYSGRISDRSKERPDDEVRRAIPHVVRRLSLETPSRPSALVPASGRSMVSVRQAVDQQRAPAVGVGEHARDAVPADTLLERTDLLEHARRQVSSAPRRNGAVTRTGSQEPPASS